MLGTIVKHIFVIMIIIIIRLRENTRSQENAQVSQFWIDVLAKKFPNHHKNSFFV